MPLRCETPNCNNKASYFADAWRDRGICRECQARVQEEKDEEVPLIDFSQPEFIMYMIEEQLNTVRKNAMSLKRDYEMSFGNIEALISAYFNTQRNR